MLVGIVAVNCYFTLCVIPSGSDRSGKKMSCYLLAFQAPAPATQKHDHLPLLLFTFHPHPPTPNSSTPTTHIPALIILYRMALHAVCFIIVLLAIASSSGAAFTLLPLNLHTPQKFSPSSTQLFMGSRRGKAGNLKRSLDDTSGVNSVAGIKSINQGRGQEITGVSLPENMKIKGWAFGEDQTIAAANVDGKYYAVDGRCPRCAFDLFKGKLLVDKGADPVVACPTCSTTYNFKTGKFGPEYKQTGLAGFVNTWAKTATINNASQDVSAFIITKDEQTGQVFCKER